MGIGWISEKLGQKKKSPFEEHAVERRDQWRHQKQINKKPYRLVKKTVRERGSMGAQGFFPVYSGKKDTEARSDITNLIH